MAPCNNIASADMTGLQAMPTHPPPPHHLPPAALLLLQTTLANVTALPLVNSISMAPGDESMAAILSLLASDHGAGWAGQPQLGLALEDDHSPVSCCCRPGCTVPNLNVGAVRLGARLSVCELCYRCLGPCFADSVVLGA
jgi:hypothetical protein